MACSVKPCKELKRFRKDNISFHHFPKSDPIRMQWIKFIGKKEPWTPTKNQFVCSKHFRECDYICGRNTLKKKRFLKPDAIPTLYFCEAQEAIIADTLYLNQNYQEPLTNGQYLNENTSIIDSSFGKDTSADSIEILEEKQLKNKTVRSGCSSPKRKSPALSFKTSDKSFSATDDICEKSRKQLRKSGSSSNSSQKRRTLSVHKIHSNCKTRGEVYKKTKRAEHQLTVYRSMLYRANKYIKRLKKNISYLQFVANQLKSKNLIYENCLEQFQKCHDGVPAASSIDIYLPV